jgi:hypothetical protein
MNCALCKSNSPLQNSHIIPEFFYTDLYEKFGHRKFHVISTDSSKPEYHKQKGIYEKLLCRSCEQKLARWEKYAKETFTDGKGLIIQRDSRILRLSNLDCRTFRLFLLSLLWRMAVSSLDFFALADIGAKHQETLRVALLNEDPLEPSQYPCLICGICIDGIFHRDWISPPMHMRSGDHHCHCIVINGILFSFYVTSHPLPAVFSEMCINKKHEMRMFIGELREIPFLTEFASDLGEALRTRKLCENKK